MSKASFVGAGDLLIVKSDPDAMLAPVAGFLQGADVTYLNLEGPITDQGERNPALAGIANAIRSQPGTAAALKRAGVDVVSLANNHTMDYRAEGLDQTLDLLDGEGIARCGGGRNRVEARKPTYLEAKGLKIGFLSYTSVCPPGYAAPEDGHGAAYVRVKTSYDGNIRLVLQPGSPMRISTTPDPKDLAEVVAEVKAARAECDALVVAWHWGVSDRWGKTSEYQHICGRAVIDAGADLVLGNHAHMLLGVEFYKGRAIFHSLGNFAFDMSHPFFRPENLLVLCDFTRNGVENLRIVPLLNDGDNVPQVARGRTRDRMLFMLEELSHGLNSTLHETEDHIEVRPLDPSR